MEQGGEVFSSYRILTFVVNEYVEMLKDIAIGL